MTERLTFDDIERAAAIIRDGGTVAFPTETVYGLGADALNADAVDKIYAAKGRPAFNPLIVHFASLNQLEEHVEEVTDAARALLDAFSPGPISTVLKKKPMIPDIVSADLPTVAVRIPSHPLARKLIELARCPIAAPSANASNRVSPTTADHVLRTLDGKIDAVLDGGPTEAGLESTVIDCTVDPPRLLRPGPVTVPDIERTVGPIDASLIDFEERVRSPGMLKKHYSPNARLVMIPASDIVRVHEHHEGSSLGFLLRTIAPQSFEKAAVIRLPDDAKAYAAQLYAALHSFDDKKVSTVYVEEPPKDADWHAVHDRLTRAAA